MYPFLDVPVPLRDVQIPAHVPHSIPDPLHKIPALCLPVHPMVAQNTIMVCNISFSFSLKMVSELENGSFFK
jgi:hypothetical protein